MVLRELAAKLGLDVDSASFTKGALAADAVKVGLEMLVGWAKSAAHAMMEVATEAVETASQLNDTSQAIGVHTDALQELGYAASLSGIGMEEFSGSIRLLSRQMNGAAQGGEEQAKMFSKLGIKVKDANGKMREAEGVLEDVAEKLSKMPDGAEKTALAMQFFGRSGAKMIPMLNEGADGIERMRQEARDLGIVLDEDLIKQGDEIGDLADGLKAMWKGIKTSVGASLFPDMLRTLKIVHSWVRENRSLIRQNLEKVFKGLASAGKFVYEVFALIYRNVDLVVGAMVLLNAQAIVAAARFALAWTIAAAPVIALGALLAGLVLFIDDFRMYLKYGDKAHTLTGRFLKNIDKWLQPNVEDPWWLRTIKEYVQYLKDAINLLKQLNDEINGTAKHNRVDKDTGLNAKDLEWRTDKLNAQEAKKRLDNNLPLTPALTASLDRLNQSDPNQLKFLQGSDYVPGVPKAAMTPSIAKSVGQAGNYGATLVEGDDVNITFSLPNATQFDEKLVKEHVMPVMKEFWDGKMAKAKAHTEK